MARSDELLQQAVALHQQGELDRARAIYQQILADDPQNPNALNLLAMVHHAQGRNAQAERILQSAIAAAPRVAGFHNNLGNVLLAQRRLDAAEEAYRRSIELQPDYAEAYNNLGVALLGQGKTDAAMNALVRAIALRHEYPSARNNLGNVLRARSMFREATDCYRDALAQQPNYADAHANLAIAHLAMSDAETAIAEARRAIELQSDAMNAYLTLGMALEQLDRRVEAADVYREALGRRPTAAGLRFQLAALTGEGEFTAVPPELVASNYDNYADTFERHLTEGLQYRGPQLLHDAIAAAGGLTQQAEVCDLGCGTGLCGPLLRPLAKRLIGVDLSPRMIGHARERNVYDELHVDELRSFLATRYAQFDLLVAADVLIYSGDLRPIFSAAAQALRVDGLFAFTLEKHEGEGYALNPTRRFSHSIGYIRSLLPELKLAEAQVSTNKLRTESGQDVSGWVIVLKRV